MLARLATRGCDSQKPLLLVRIRTIDDVRFSRDLWRNFEKLVLDEVAGAEAGNAVDGGEEFAVEADGRAAAARAQG